MTPPPQPPEPALHDWLAEQFDTLHESLRMLEMRQTIILELLTPKESEGPSLTDLLAGLVTLLADQKPVIRRIDYTTGRALDHLEGRTPRTPSPEEPDCVPEEDIDVLGESDEA